jgi:hypothetical protein
MQVALIHGLDAKGPVQDAKGVLHWPVLFVYPQHAQSDFVEQFCELDSLQQHLEASGCAGHQTTRLSQATGGGAGFRRLCSPTARQDRACRGMSTTNTSMPRTCHFGVVLCTSGPDTARLAQRKAARCVLQGQ